MLGIALLSAAPFLLSLNLTVAARRRCAALETYAAFFERLADVCAGACLPTPVLLRLAAEGARVAQFSSFFRDACTGDLPDAWHRLAASQPLLTARERDVLGSFAGALSETDEMRFAAACRDRRQFFSLQAETAYKVCRERERLRLAIGAAASVLPAVLLL
ncbi:MAG: hypothetical protein IJK02_08470 [Clostridia bacterium]|nr:hypothetical protein [Clostridia bacterium]MBR0537664.1 hypothetical protein [Clostridia bacterium]